MTIETAVAVVAIVAALAVWGAVVLRSVRERASLPLLALVLIVAGLLGTQLLGLAAVPTPGAWSFIAVGVLLLLLWPRHEGAHTCPVCGRPHEWID